MYTRQKKGHMPRPRGGSVQSMVKGPALHGLFHKKALSLSLDKTAVLSLDYLGIMLLVTEPESLSTP